MSSAARSRPFWFSATAEYVIPGFGVLTLDAIQQRDYTLLQGVVLVSAAGYVIVNLTVDLLYSVLNPRIRVAGAPA